MIRVTDSEGIVARDDSNVTGLIIDVEDFKAFKSFLDSPEGSRAKTADGVKSETMTILSEVSQS